MTRPHAGREPGGRRAVAMGLFGIGPCVANALSSRLTAEVRREGVRWMQEYERGVALAPPGAAGPATGTGTTIAFRPDGTVFGSAQCEFDVLAECFRELAFLNRGLDITLTDERDPGGPRVVRFRFPGGVRDFVAALGVRSGAPVRSDVLGFEREVPRMAGTIEVALQWCDSREEDVRGFTNSLATDTGTHEAGLREGVAAAIDAYARARVLQTAADRIGEGLTAVVSVKLDDPDFVDFARREPGGDAVRACVARAVREHLGARFEAHPEQAAAVITPVLRAAARN
ncbi:hypothetical protein [Streptomyces sp. NPDC056491]|uniref:hypothetical protein n=1 Tax=Streptomyces sp. NPDC056491 TaxID=3345837 RepID=UPI0036A0575D